MEHCFEFLLVRQPKESIRSQFEIGTIVEQFPDFPEELRVRMMANLRPVTAVSEDDLPSTTECYEQWQCVREPQASGDERP